MLFFRNILVLLFSCSVIIMQECPPADTVVVVSQQDNWNIPYINSWNELEVMTWNLKQFPISQSTINNVEEIISDMLPDVINFQEVWDLEQKMILTEMLPEYEFVLLPGDEDGWYGLDIAFRKDCLNLINYSTLFESYGYEFAWRYPLSANLVWSCGDSFIDFEMINVHFKCCDDGFERRLASSQILSSYIDNQTSAGINIIAAGDYNDSLDDIDLDNSLLPLIQNDNIQFIDFEIAEGPVSNWSYPTYPSHIDHILVNDNLYDQVLYYESLTVIIEDYVGFNFYQNNISDHRPVLWKANFNEIQIPTGIVINEIMNNPSLDNETNGEWFEIINIGLNTVDLFGFIISDNDLDEHIISEHIIINPNELLVFGSSQNYDLNGNIEVDYEYSNFYLSNLFDEIIIKHPSGVVLDEVFYDYNQSFPNSESFSMMLLNPILDNNFGENWVSSAIPIGNGDFGSPGQSNQESCNSIGDSNLDGTVDVLDVVKILNYILNDSSLNSQELCQADANQDQNINIVDIVLIVGYILYDE